MCIKRRGGRPEKGETGKRGRGGDGLKGDVTNYQPPSERLVISAFRVVSPFWDVPFLGLSPFRVLIVGIAPVAPDGLLDPSHGLGRDVADGIDHVGGRERDEPATDGG